MSIQLTNAQKEELQNLKARMDENQKVIVHENEESLPLIQRELLLKGLLYYQRPVRAIDHCCLYITSMGIECLEKPTSSKSQPLTQGTKETSRLERAGRFAKFVFDVAERLIKIIKQVVEMSIIP